MIRKASDILSTEQLLEMGNLNTKQDKCVYLSNLGFSADEIAFNLATSKASVQSMLSRSGGTISTNTQRFSSGQMISNQVNAELEDAAPKKPFELHTEKISSMEFPDYKCFRTGTIIDKMLSDHSEEGGAFSGCVYVVPGESGSGKSTWLIDYIVKLMDFSEANGTDAAKPCYVSGEMTKNDLYFYMAKMPGIGKVDTLLCNEYMREGQLKDAIEAIFTSDDFNIIILDSYQDIVEKMRDAYAMKEAQCENWLINLMVQAAEKQGKLVFAIQHMTKGGQYVGGTFLKHVTTGMIFVMKDKINPSERYIMVSKNRRGGSMTDRPLYFILKDGAVHYDDARFDSDTAARNSSAMNNDVKEEMASNFQKLMNIHGIKVNAPDPTEAELDEIEAKAEAEQREFENSLDDVDEDEDEDEETIVAEHIGHGLIPGHIQDATIVQ